MEPLEGTGFLAILDTGRPGRTLALRADISSAQEVMPAEQILHDVTWFASESFSRYASCAPSMFAFIGIRNPSAGSGAEHHNPSFDVDEDALQTGVLMMCKFTVDFLRKQWWERDFMHEKCLPFC